MKLIVGLGNPGKEYENTRHNMGFMFLDACAKKYNFEFSKEKYGGKYAEVRIAGEKIIFLKPQKYMNLSGGVISSFVNFFKIELDDIFIIYDDMHTEVGKFKIRYKGSSGGHNGLKDIERHLNTREYRRLKIGISSNGNHEMRDYVLGNINKAEKDKIMEVMDKASNIIEDYLTLTFDNLMNKYN